ARVRGRHPGRHLRDHGGALHPEAARRRREPGRRNGRGRPGLGPQPKTGLSAELLEIVRASNEERITMQLTSADIRLGAQARNKEDAIRQVGALLATNGNVAPGYIDSMLGREQQANTYLGHGIAIPHGMPQDRELIRRTGIAVMQIPAGVTWNAGETVHLVVGIAARSDEHLQVLASLTDVLDDPAPADRPATTPDAADIVASLSRRGGSPAGAAVEDLAGAQSVQVVIGGSTGLHARPATMVVEVASRFASEIRVQHDGRAANGKSLASLLKLGVESGQPIQILAVGADADAALIALREAVESGLGDEDTPEQIATSERLWAPLASSRAIVGVPGSPGLAIGPLAQFKHTRVVVTDKP